MKKNKLALAIASRNIRSYASFRPGWNHGSGHSFKKNVIEKSIILLQALFQHDFGIRTFPNDDGSITISFFYDEEFFDIRILNDNGFELTHERGIGQDFEEIICEIMSFSQIHDYIKSFCHNKEKCYSHGSLTYAISIRKKIGFSLDHFLRLQPITVPQLFLQNVSPTKVNTKIFVSTSELIMSKSQEIQSYIGSSIPIICQSHVTL